MRFKSRAVFKWSGRVLLVLFVVVLLDLAAVAFPYPLFEHQGRFGCCTVYSDTEIDPNLAAILQDVNERLQAVELYREDGHFRVFLCRNPKRFALFARMSLVNPAVQGFNLSIFGNTFISESRVRRFGMSAGAVPPHSMREGDLAHVIAHELVHDATEEALGFWTYYRLPNWKREGYAEYGSTIADIRNDPDSDLMTRIGYLEDLTFWDPRSPFVRDYYRAQLLVEFLSEHRNFRFADIMRDDVTLKDTYRSMMDWYHQQKAPRVR